MLDHNNSLLTDVSDEECATVSGGLIIKPNPDGSYDFSTIINGITLKTTGPNPTDVKATEFTFNSIVAINADGQITIGGNIYTPDSPTPEVTLPFLP